MAPPTACLTMTKGHAMSRRDPSETEAATNVSANTNAPDHTASRPVASGPPQWAEAVLTARQLSDLNPSFVWLKVVLSEKVKLSPRAKNVAAVLYSCAYVDGGRFGVGTRRLADMLNRGRGFVDGGLADLAGEGFLVVHDEGKGQRNGYQLSLPIDPPSGTPTEPRRTGGTDSGPRRTADPEKGSGTHREPQWHSQQATSGTRSEPRRATDQREQLSGEPTTEELEAFVASTLNSNLTPDQAMSIARHEVASRADHWTERLARERQGGGGAVDRFIDAIGDKIHGDARDKLERERQRKNNKLAAWFTATGTDPSLAARVVLEQCDLNRANTSVLGLAHKVLTEKIGAAA